MAQSKGKKQEAIGVQVASIDDLKAGKKPLTKKVTIFLNDEHLADLEDARGEFDRASQLHRSNPEKYAERLEKAERALDEALAVAKEDARELIFKAIGRKRYDALLRQHPPTDEQIEEVQKELNQRPGFNGDTFPQALVAASLHQPKLEVEDVQEIFDEWNSSEINELFAAAMEVNTGRRTAELGK